MDKLIHHISEQQAAAAFNDQSAVFDDLYAGNSIISYKRKRVRDHVLELLQHGAKMLELNAGTGDDAVFFGQQGYRVHATDLSAGMQEKLQEKVLLHGLTSLISNETCSYTDLISLKNKGPYDHIFSNFAGLNCTGELEKVTERFDELLKPGGTVTLVMLPSFCLWESLLLFKGKFKTATRRFFSSKGRTANINGLKFTCWYYSPSFVNRLLEKKFTLIKTEGLCTVVPPSYIEGFAEKHPKLFPALCRKEDRLKEKWPWKNIGDYYIISFRKKDL